MQCVLTLFPHYAVYGRRALDAGAHAFVAWIVIQNLTVGCFGMLAGPAADWYGNRLVFVVLLALGGLAPLLAICLGHSNAELGRSLFWLIFVLLGLTPVTQRILTNYTLEIVGQAQHSLYLGILNFARGLPFMFSPLFGWLIDLTSFELVFALGSLSAFASFLFARGLIEPRFARPPTVVAPGEAETMS
jgi:MFS family permease